MTAVVADEGSNVIHVSFGERKRIDGPIATDSLPSSSANDIHEHPDIAAAERSGPRTDRPPSDKTEGVKKPSIPAPALDDPASSFYTARDVSSVLDIPETKLRYWSRSGFLTPSARKGRRRFYTFQDLVQLRAARELLRSGIPFRQVRESVEALKDSLGKRIAPLTQLRVTGDGNSLIVRDESVAFEPATGQVVLDFDVSEVRDAAVRVLMRDTTDAGKKAAYEHYLEGCRYDEEPDQIERAAAAYRKAVHCDPSMSHAHTNLGNLLYRQGKVAEAKQFYLTALQVDPEQPEALYNLGCMALEANDIVEATFQLEQAVSIDPGFADGHFNLALSYERDERFEEAQQHWQVFLELETDGPYAEQARQKLLSLLDSD